ncbi:MAG: hypothetical protein ACNA8W_21560, partial [Bradymonadaceae bacterium]
LRGRRSMGKMVILPWWSGALAPAEPQPGCSPLRKLWGSVAGHHANRTNDPSQAIKHRQMDHSGPMNVAEAIVHLWFARPHL